MGVPNKPANVYNAKLSLADDDDAIVIRVHAQEIDQGPLKMLRVLHTPTATDSAVQIQGDQSAIFRKGSHKYAYHALKKWLLCKNFGNLAFICFSRALLCTTYVG